MGFGNGLQSFSHSASRDASRRPLLSCRFGQRRLLSSELEMGLCPCFPRLRRDQSFAAVVAVFARASPAVSFDISPIVGPTEAGPGFGERPKPPKG
jgi:hypothetical protein